MLQIIIWLGCVYLVFKGKELVTIAESSAPDVREEAQKSAHKWFVLSILFAVIFAFLALAQGSSMPRGF